ncbi:MAG: ABC transporter permease [Candidatus Marivariicella sp.]
MNFSLRVALKYVFSKNKKSIIARINRFSIITLIISSTSLLIVLSGFEGLKNFGMSLYEVFEPDFSIIPKQGKKITILNSEIKKVNSLKDVIFASGVIEEKVFLSFKDKNHVGYLKGISPSYLNINPIDSLITRGNWLDYSSESIILGEGLSQVLGAGINDYSSFLEVSVPKNKKLRFGETPFKSKFSTVTGIFQISKEFDDKYIFCSTDFARELLGFSENTYSHLALKTKKKISKKELNQMLREILHEEYILESRADKNSAINRMVEIENLAVYLIFSLVIIISLFNLIGSLLMMFLDKSDELKTILSMGETPKNIQKIFLIIGLLISSTGSLFGIVLGSILLLMQEYFPFLYVPGTSIPYPVILKIENLLVVFLTVLLLGGFTSLWATRGMKKPIL